MNQFLVDIGEKIGAGIVGLSLIVGSVFGYTPPPQNFAATFQTPEVRALFETTLASRISATDTSFTLTSATDIDGTSLASSTYAFIIDEGTASEELVLADCTATACTNATRGLSGRTGTTTVTTLRSEHRRGASVKITDAPALIYVMNVLKGTQNMEGLVRYASGVTPASGGDLTDYEFVTGLAFNGAGVIDATAVAKGVVELATGAEAAASTAAGTSGNLALPASIATSTYNSATAANRVVVTGSDGKIDANFLNVPIGSLTVYASTTAPDGWLLANGSAVSRSTYSGLFSILGTSYGSGDGSTTFNLPDIRGRTVVMASSTQVALQGLNRSTLGATGTTTSHTLNIAQIPSHDHGVGGTLVTRIAPLTGEAEGNGSGGNNSSDQSLSAQGGGEAHNILDPYIILNYIIKY
jgi:microcystin-dependent protein